MTQLPGFKTITEDISLKGIVKIEKDENGMVGLEIPECMKINNLFEESRGNIATGRNLLMEYPHSNILYKDSSYLLQDTGQTETISIMQHNITCNIYTCENYPDAKFVFSYDLGFFLKDSGNHPFLWSEEDQFIRDKGNYSLDGFLGVSKIQCPENMYPPTMINSFNQTDASFDGIVFSNMSYMQYQILINSFNDLQTPISLHLNYVNYNLNNSDILSCFGGSTNGYVLFSNENYQELLTSNLIIPLDGDESFYVLAHNHNVVVYDRVPNADMIGDLI